MDVKIGVLHSPREIIVDSAESQDDVSQAVNDALGNPGASATLELLDKRGRKVIVPVANVAYVEISEGDGRRVGFMAG